ncbi:Centromere protein Cenp-O [Cordyceps fumosorosea ARSEF 2679]|uniref:Centromere protein Cenp-O n=1 Tax=Cordyceps fumosorosea (strain ARSEF 2679) TaxID=1081104 RepID=A0A167NM59_CORFA|nr:Centromere protein Cenp-O [Cordyceps fumosorosea ARSEF 2679]OAA55707.1 Centromere protein Cenp-O [Cordyceps fumosorosea ARSEF 2679]
MEEQENTQPPTDPLDKEIASLKKRVAAMKKRLQIECSTILSSTPIQNIIQDASAATSNTSSFLKSALRPAPHAAASLQKRSAQQAAYMQQCAYRIAAPVTAFKVRDPDPHAVDRGHVLGLRFEVMSQGHFLRPYYVLLNRPWADDPSSSHHLRVHRHTVPPAVPLAGLAARHLPPPRAGDAPAQTRQDLGRFARALRREIARFHNRLGLTADLRKTVGLARKGSRRSTTAGGAREVVEAGIADVEAKHVKLAWADGRSGRILMDRDGRVERFVVFGPHGGRDWRMTRMLCDASDGVDDIARKLQRYAAA